ncbi:hypothetical protein LINGRAHAP2_LOCUS27839 [Linum grandiflorum]
MQYLGGNLGGWEHQHWSIIDQILGPS